MSLKKCILVEKYGIEKQPVGVVVQHISMGASSLARDFRAGLIGRAVAHGLPLLPRFFGTLLTKH